MSSEKYAPGAAFGAEVRKEGHRWTPRSRPRVGSSGDEGLASTDRSGTSGPRPRGFGGWQRLNAEYAKQFRIEVTNPHPTI